MYPFYGIDKLTVLLQPILYPYIQRKYVDPRNRLTLHRRYGYIYLSLHFEFIDPTLDMRTNIANAVFHLIESGVLPLPSNALAKEYIYTNLEKFVWQLSALELFFQLREEDIAFDEDEADPNIPNELKHLNHFGSTVYSNDFVCGMLTSRIILYNKYEQLRDKRQHVDEVFMKFPMRLEFKFYKNNSNYLSLKALYGKNADEIIELFTPHMASLYKKLFWGYVYVETTINPVFTNIYKMAMYSTTRERGKLKGYKGSENPKLTRDDNNTAYTLLMMEMNHFIRDNDKGHAGTCVRKKVVVRKRKLQS